MIRCFKILEGIFNRLKKYPGIFKDFKEFTDLKKIARGFNDFPRIWEDMERFFGFIRS